LGFTLGSDALTGSLLRTLAASKPAGQLLELGTGTGIGTSWLLAGMDSASRLTTVDSDARVVAIGRKHLGHDARVVFEVADAAELIGRLRGRQFDLIFADTWAGKFTDLAAALTLVKPGGFYLVDDLLSQLTWPEGHMQRVSQLIEEIENQPYFDLTKLRVASGIIVATRKAAMNT
jgi:predicted O-methyltransferase YrrM